MWTVSANSSSRLAAKRLALSVQDMDVVTGTTPSEETVTSPVGRGTPSGVIGTTTVPVLTTVAPASMTGLAMAQAMDVTTALLVSHPVKTCASCESSSGRSLHAPAHVQCSQSDIMVMFSVYFACFMLCCSQAGSAKGES